MGAPPLGHTSDRVNVTDLYNQLSLPPYRIAPRPRADPSACCTDRCMQMNLLCMNTGHSGHDSTADVCETATEKPWQLRGQILRGHLVSGKPSPGGRRARTPRGATDKRTNSVVAVVGRMVGSAQRVPSLRQANQRHLRVDTRRSSSGDAGHRADALLFEEIPAAFNLPAVTGLCEMGLAVAVRTLPSGLVSPSVS